MTYHEIKELSDGTRQYACGHFYKPVPDSKRRYARRRPADPRAVRFHGDWFVPFDTLPMGKRSMPETRPDSQAYEHALTTVLCRCAVCTRPPEITRRWFNRALRERGLAPKKISG